MANIAWLTVAAVMQMHDRHIATTGGVSGFEESKLEDALARVEYRFYYSEIQDIRQIAAFYTFAIARGYLFKDGNKRTAASSLAVFLNLNGYQLTASYDELADVLELVTKNDPNERLTFEELIEWLKPRMEEL